MMNLLLKSSSIKAFSSESSKYPARNLLCQSPWKCKEWADYSWVVLELSEETIIDSITVVNNNSAFIEVFASQFFDSQFEVLVPVFSSQSPSHSKAKTKGDKKFVIDSKLLTPVKNNPCKFIKCVCSQPFNKDVRFGLSCITISGDKYKAPKKHESFGKFKPIKNNSVDGDKFSKDALEKNSRHKEILDEKKNEINVETKSKNNKKNNSQKQDAYDSDVIYNLDTEEEE